MAGDSGNPHIDSGDDSHKYRDSRSRVLDIDTIDKNESCTTAINYNSNSHHTSSNTSSNSNKHNANVIKSKPASWTLTVPIKASLSPSSPRIGAKRCRRSSHHQLPSPSPSTFSSSQSLSSLNIQQKIRLRRQKQQQQHQNTTSKVQDLVVVDLISQKAPLPPQAQHVPPNNIETSESVDDNSNFLTNTTSDNDDNLNKNTNSSYKRRRPICKGGVSASRVTLRVGGALHDNPCWAKLDKDRSISTMARADKQLPKSEKRRKRHQHPPQPASSNATASVTVNARSQRAEKRRRTPSQPRQTTPDPSSDPSSDPPSDPSSDPHSKARPKKKQRKPVEKPKPYIRTPDPNPFYIEEEAHLYHNPPSPSNFTEGVPMEDLKPLPPPCPLPQPPPPAPGRCCWTLDSHQRVLLADFSNSNFIHPDDEKFLLTAMERNDLTVVTQGWLPFQQLNPILWDLNRILASIGQTFFHTFRRYDALTKKTENSVHHQPQPHDKPYSMRLGDYGKYLQLRMQQILSSSEPTSEAATEQNSFFRFEDHEGKRHELDPLKSTLVLENMDLRRVLPDLCSDFQDAFQYSAVLPGGVHCMMNQVTPSARPETGPLLSVAPSSAGASKGLFQSGNGTTDAAHLVVAGRREAVLLRRLTARHTERAKSLLESPLSDSAASWPSKEGIEECRKMGYCPSVLVLEPGQLLHVNKGRLHAIRTMSALPLPLEDCHANLRDEPTSSWPEEVCVSLSWDWMFRGLNPQGINREVLATLEAAIRNRRHKLPSLGIPELSLIRMAQAHAAPQKSFEVPRILPNRAGARTDCVSSTNRDQRPQTDTDICRGILPGLRCLVKEHLTAMDSVEGTTKEETAEGTQEEKQRKHERGEKISISERPNIDENPVTFSVDPYGNSGYACKLCHKELSNIYFHCDGCEQLLDRDFNICSECHANKKYMVLVPMHPNDREVHAMINHTGHLSGEQKKRCPECRTTKKTKAMACGACGYCHGCSCRCHTWFTLNYRLFGREIEENLLDHVEQTVAGDCRTDKYLDDVEFSFKRLAYAKQH